MDVHRTNDIAQHIGKCDNPQQSAFLTTFSFFLLKANQYTRPKTLNATITTNLAFDDNQAMYTFLFDELKKRAY